MTFWKMDLFPGIWFEVQWHFSKKTTDLSAHKRSSIGGGMFSFLRAEANKTRDGSHLYTFSAVSGLLRRSHFVPSP
jgi:hypothetical protein